ncbi:regulatory protein RecX [Roseibium polysiphoniae]|uniref:regulatory protein RecX n=1 Tax=Roseibium polysiphoniae TaxID=2571221 RepID=UPI00329A0165
MSERQDKNGGRAAGKRYKIPTEERLTRSAIHYLDRYSSSAANLQRVLERKVMRAAHFHERDPAEFSDMIDAVVAKCQRTGMVNDVTFAETKVASQRRRGRSQRQIEARLRSKGVSAEIVTQALEQSDTSDLEAAVIFARRRRLGPWRTRGARADYRDKDMAALCRAGFNFDMARHIVDGSPEDQEPDS